ncbi:MAG TPA: FAD-dependent oxidoreductase, partial [Thermomicrobiales bacterium]|nr:FAD-dependent oxidoreductase [Thermomicrobiales bacterium]
SLPVGRFDTGDGRTGLVIGNKSGRQVIRCHTIVDATESAVVARVCGARFEDWPDGPSRFSRTLEFDRSRAFDIDTFEVPAGFGVARDSVRLHRGYRGDGHILVELDLDLPYSPDTQGATDADVEARRRSMRLATWLIETRAELAEARYAGSSHELHGRWSPSLADPPPAWASAAQEPVAVANDVVANASFAGPVPNLWCLSGAARLSPECARAFFDPLMASRIGESLADSLTRTPLADIQTDLHPRHASLDASRIDIEILEPDSPQRGRDYPRERVPPSSVPSHPATDVLVVGGGSSGATAAITAAREGMRTVLVDMNPGPGGTGTYGGVDSYWYGRHVGFAAELERRVGAANASLRHTGGKWNVDAKTQVLLEDAIEAGVECLFHSLAVGALVDDNRVRGAIVATRWGPIAITSEVVIDATGDGDIAAFAGAAFTYGAERTHSVMWYSLAQYAAPGLIRNNFTSTVDVSNIEDYTRAILAGRRRGDGTHDHGIYLATRESRHVRGGTVMTLTDQLRKRQWPDVVNVHYSNHDIKGQTESPWLRSGLIPPNLEVEIPYRLVVPEGIEGILIAGKAISATHDALPAVRMQADLENLGGVVALAAAQAIREGVAPRDIDLRRLQRRLVDAGLISEEMLTREVVVREYTDAELESLVGALDGEHPLYSYSDMHMGELFEGLIPFVEVCSAAERAVPVLERAHEEAEGAREVVLAQALAICGSHAGVPTLIAAIEQEIAGGTLPPRDSNIRHAGFPPDQGAMPDLAYLLFGLGMVPDRRALPTWVRVCELLEPTEENLRDRFAGTFSYIDAVCHAAERSCDPEMVPLLSKLHAHGTLRDQVCRQGIQPDFFLERQAMLEVGIGRALARCGGLEGYEVLIDYLADVRALLAERAHSELIDLTGQDFGKRAGAWRQTRHRVTARPRHQRRSEDHPGERRSAGGPGRPTRVLDCLYTRGYCFFGSGAGGLRGAATPTDGFVLRDGFGNV